MKRPLPLFICIDIEPDAFRVDRRRPDAWTGAARAFEFMRRARERILSRTGVELRTSWFLRMDAQVETAYGSIQWGADRFGEQLHEAAARGDEIGLHTHGYRWSDSHGGWLVDHANLAFLEESVQRAVEAFRQSFGRPCRILRFGDRWMHTATMNLLERLGIVADLTVEPGEPARPTYHSRMPFTGSLPDYSSAPTCLYTPDRADYLAKSPVPRGIVEIPISSIRTAVPWQGLRRLAYRLTNSPYRSRTNWRLNIHQHPLAVGTILDGLLADASTTHVTAVFRTAALLRHAGNVAAGLDALCAEALRGRLLPATPERWVASVKGSDAMIRLG